MELISSMNIADSTKITYMNKLKKIEKLGIQWKENEDIIIQKLDNLQDTSLENKLSYLNICFVLKKSNNEDTHILRKYRDKLMKIKNNTQTETNQKNSVQGLPTTNEIIKYINSLYNEHKYKEFIINNLIFYCSCRNADVNLIITRNLENDDDHNYLIVLDNENIRFIRNVYKTSNKYKQKSININSIELSNSCNVLLGTKQSVNLLKNTKNICGEILTSTYNCMGSSRYLKSKLQESKISSLKEISNNRGTSINTLINYYS